MRSSFAAPASPIAPPPSGTCSPLAAASKRLAKASSFSFRSLSSAVGAIEFRLAPSYAACDRTQGATGPYTHRTVLLRTSNPARFMTS